MAIGKALLPVTVLLSVNFFTSHVFIQSPKYKELKVLSSLMTSSQHYVTL